MQKESGGNNYIPEKKPPQTKIKSIIVIVCLLFVSVISFFGGYFVNYSSQSETSKLISELTRLIEEYSKNPDGDKEITKEELAKKIVEIALEEDKYAKYYTAEEYQALLEESSGTYSGIGVSLSVGKRKINDVIWNSPAERAGLLSGDVVTQGKLCEDEEYTVFEDKDTNKEGTFGYFIKQCKIGDTIDLKIQRQSESEPVNISVTIQQYTNVYVKYCDNEQEMIFRSEEGSLMISPRVDDTKGDASLDDKTAYIQLTQFEGGAAEQFSEAMKLFKSRGKTKLILDLRDNGGGSMSVLLDIASYLIKGKGAIVNRIAVAEEKDRRTDFITSANYYNDDIEKIVILANSNTASASEVLIGAMAYDGANGGGKFTLSNLVTTYNESRNDYSTFGKGIMQTIYQLSDGSALKLTTAVLYQPDMVTSIHGKGIVSADEANHARDNTKAYNRAIEILGMV